MQVVIAVAGQEQSFLKAGFQTPKFLIPFFQREALVHVIRSFPAAWKKIVVLSVDFDSRSKLTLEKITSNKNLNVQLVEDVRSALSHLDLQQPVWVTDGKIAFSDSVEAIQDKWSSYDLGLLNFTGFHPSYLGSSTYSHIQLSTDETEVVKVFRGERLQKNILDEVTSAGVFYFKTASLLKELRTEVSIADVMASAVEGKKYRVGSHLISNFLQMGTADDKVRADYWFDFITQKYPNLESVYSQLPVHQENLQEILHLPPGDDDLLGLDYLRGLRTVFEEEKKYWLRCWSGLQKI